MLYWLYLVAVLVLVSESMAGYYGSRERFGDRFNNYDRGGNKGRGGYNERHGYNRRGGYEDSRNEDEGDNNDRGGKNQVNVADLLTKMDKLQSTVQGLLKQTAALHDFVEERIRGEGQSGLKQVRHDTEGTKNYFGSSHIDTGIGGVHDHSDYNRLLGMGEVQYVMNGVDFRTRHNDYRLVRPSTTSRDFKAVEDIPFPGVPPEVTSKATPEEQIEEMKIWFEAFKTQNSTLRNYTQYFKPVISYIEGMWTTDDDSIISEAFVSDRHHFDAFSWDNMQGKARYLAYTGAKDNFENVGFMPRRLMYVDNVTGEPVYGQWNYRIVCYPIDFDIPVKYLRQREDFLWRYPRRFTKEEVLLTRAARFTLNDQDSDQIFTETTLLDKIFQDIPGLDNIPDPNLIEAWNAPLKNPLDANQTLRQGYYHHSYLMSEPGAMGATLTYRGWSDQYLYVALNTQPRIVKVSMKDCKDGACQEYSARVSWSVPLEMIYLTPLLSWNPYDIELNDNDTRTKSGGRDGETDGTAYLGIDTKNYYMTPYSFFSGPPLEPDDADTPRQKVKVVNRKGEIKEVTASGTRFFLPPIGNLGYIRLRYPFGIIHGEGNAAWKELNALRDYIDPK